MLIPITGSEAMGVPLLTSPIRSSYWRETWMNFLEREGTRPPVGLGFHEMIHFAISRLSMLVLGPGLHVSLRAQCIPQDLTLWKVSHQKRPGRLIYNSLHYTLTLMRIGLITMILSVHSPFTITETRLVTSAI